jgi:predicted AlkP superfamily pyrophosphatase or phosphodiesterase
MRRLAVLLCLLVASACAGRGLDVTANRQPAPLIVVSIDGWRWDYATKAPAPTLRALAARGVRAENLIPVFPSKTFPNHYTIVTGLYPGHHGMVANTVRDPATGRTLVRTNVAEVRDPMWWGGEPIWVTAQKGGLNAAAMFWPGSEAPIGGMLPRYWKPYDASFPPAERVDQVLQWLDLPAAERPALINLYFSDVDSAGHDFGPDSPEVQESIRAVDGYLARLIRGLIARNMMSTVNLVVLSDHGMAAVDDERVVVLDDYVAAADVDVVDINPTLGLFPRGGKDAAIYGALEGAHPRLRVFHSHETPAQWHYRDHPRIPPIVGVADEGWQVLRRATVNEIRAGRIRGERGNHGYDPALMSMRGIFIAAGPAFRAGASVPAFENVHIYNALAAALGVPAGNNDGNKEIAQSLLR